MRVSDESVEIGATVELAGPDMSLESSEEPQSGNDGAVDSAVIYHPGVEGATASVGSTSSALEVRGPVDDTPLTAGV